MSSVLIERDNLDTRIKEHTPERDEFKSWAEGARCKYEVVTPTMMPGRKYFWGHCRERGVYFISSDVPVAHRVGVLQMEYHRVHHDLSRLEAVQYALQQPTRINPTDFAKTLRSFYREEALPFEESGIVKVDDRGQDILATKEFLERALS